MAIIRSVLVNGAVSNGKEGHGWGSHESWIKGQKIINLYNDRCDSEVSYCVINQNDGRYITHMDCDWRGNGDDALMSCLKEVFPEEDLMFIHYSWDFDEETFKEYETVFDFISKSIHKYDFSDSDYCRFGINEAIEQGVAIWKSYYPDAEINVDTLRKELEEFYSKEKDED